MVIDSHVHFWKYDKKRDAWMDDMKILQKDYIPHELESTLKRNGVDGCVAVQADQSETETLFLMELSKTHPIIKGVVGWVDLQADNVSERLQYFTEWPVIKGFRHVAQSEPDDFLLRPNFQRGVAALAEFSYTYDILIYHHQLKAAIELVSKFPEQKFILDHCAKPAIRDHNIQQWKADIQELAKYENVSCKVSGLLTEAKWKGWSAGDFYPYLDVIFKEFGAGRVVYGSDWPVMLVSGIYVQWKSLLEKYMEDYIDEDKLKVFGENAKQFYNL